MRILLTAALTAPLALTLAVVGCSSDAEPASPPVTTDAAADGAAGPDAGTPAIGARGGVVVASDGRAQLSVPALAIGTDTAIAIAPSTKPADAKIVSGAYELSPNGATFDRDLDLCIETASHVNAQDACLAYYDDASSTWTCEDKCLKRQGSTNVLCGHTNHFTSFAILLSGNGATTEGACESGLVSPAGGSIVAPNGEAVATFAGSTLEKPTRVTVTKVPAPSGAELGSAVFALDAHGVTTFGRDVEVCLRGDPAKSLENACLGYFDETSNPPTWKCEDRCLSRRANGDEYCGSTSHFTSFAILLGSGAASAACTDALIPPTGGTLLSLDKVASFVAHDGTFTKPTRVTIARAPSEKSLGSDVFQLLPDGPLPKPGRVCLTPNPDAALESACLGYKDAAGSWKCEDTCLVRESESSSALCGETSHFTSFAILLQGGSGAGSACVR